METITFECESITPMFMYGVDGKTLELRPASIKGVMRFWWRAIHRNLMRLDELKKQEDEIFGNTEKKSKLIIYPIEITNSENYEISLTPHHEKGYCSQNDKTKGCFFKNNKCMKANKKTGKFYTFTLQMSIKDNSYLNKEQLINLFKLSTLLGGFGQRNRRGFGSIRIKKIDNNSFTLPKTAEEIKIIISKINKEFKYQSNINYPYIKDLKVGKTYSSYQNLLETIGRASHDYNCDELGYARREGRLASPIYVSILKFEEKDYRPVITTLKNTKLNSNKKVNDFKKAIL